jgi:hypothetical protein
MLRHAAIAIRDARNRCSFAIVIASCVLCGAASVASAADKAPLSAARLKVWANWAIRTRAIQFDPPRNRVAGDTMEVEDVAVLSATEHDADNLYVRALMDQIEIELRREQLLQRANSRRIMEPFYAKMEQIVAKKLALVEDAKRSADDRDAKTNELNDQLMAAYSDGLTAVAKSINLAKFEFVAEAPSRSGYVTLVASPGTTIDMVRPLTAGLLKEAGVAEADYPWSSYKAGDTASLLGAYYCRISLNGRQAIVSKKVGQTMTTLEFSNP